MLCKGKHQFHWWIINTWNSSTVMQSLCRCGLTKDGHHNVIFEDFDGTTGHKVECCEHIPTVDKCVSRRSMGSFEPHGQGPEAALGGSTKCLTILEEALVEVEANISLQTLWETLQDLRIKYRSNSTWVWTVVKWKCIIMFKAYSQCVFVCYYRPNRWAFQRNLGQLPLVFFPSSQNVLHPREGITLSFYRELHFTFSFSLWAAFSERDKTGHLGTEKFQMNESKNSKNGLDV